MPLIMITGYPCCGKTTRSLELKDYFEKRLKPNGQNVEIISETDAIVKVGYDKNAFYSDSKKEKIVRSALKSEIQRKLNTRDLLIFDGSNYIMGYRYEIYCMTKLYKTPQCTIYCSGPIEHAWLLNDKRLESERYNTEVFDALYSRYETPDGKKRWEAPLFAVTPEDELSYDEIYKSLYEVAAPKPNLSTQNAPLAATTFLYELDKITQDVINVSHSIFSDVIRKISNKDRLLVAKGKELAILSARQLGIHNDIKVPGSNAMVRNSATAAQLMRLRRQFLTYSKMQQSAIDQITTLFVQYLNKNL